MKSLGFLFAFLSAINSDRSRPYFRRPCRRRRRQPPPEQPARKQDTPDSDQRAIVRQHRREPDTGPMQRVASSRAVDIVLDCRVHRVEAVSPSSLRA